MSKRCTKCGEVKDLSAFKKYHRNKDGHDSACKLCDHQYYLDNKEHIQRYQKQYVLDNKTKILEAKKKYYLDNKEQISNKAKIYRKANKDALSVKSKIYCENNKEKRKKYREKNREIIKEKKKEYNEKNKEKRKEYQQIYHEKNIERSGEYDRLRYLTFREQILNLRKIASKNIDDNYVISQLTKRTSLTAEDIRQYNNIIETKRESIKLNRLINQLSK